MKQMTVMMSVRHLLNRTIWSITPDTLENFVSCQLNSQLNNPNMVNEPINSESDDLSKPFRVKDTLVFPIKGILVPRVDYWSRFFGLSGTLDLRESLYKAVSENTDLKRVVLNIDSPGGITIGCNELISMIDEVTNSGIEVVSYSEVELCSLAYRIACAGSKIYATSSAIVGSIGVILSVYKSSNAGNFIFAKGDLKTGGTNGFMSTKEMVHYSDWVDKEYDSFTKFVSERRNKPIQEVVDTESKCITAEWEPWFVDEFVNGIDELII